VASLFAPGFGHFRSESNLSFKLRHASSVMVNEGSFANVSRSSKSTVLERQFRYPVSLQRRQTCPARQHALRATSTWKYDNVLNTTAKSTASTRRQRTPRLGVRCRIVGAVLVVVFSAQCCTCTLTCVPARSMPSLLHAMRCKGALAGESVKILHTPQLSDDAFAKALSNDSRHSACRAGTLS